MIHREGHRTGARRLDLYWQGWIPEGLPRAEVVLVHGGSEHSGRYAWVGEQFAARGYAVYAMDNRGHGRSEGPRAYYDRMANVISDLRGFVGQVAEESGRRPWLLGHSLGGLISLAYTTRHQEEVEGLVLTAPVAVIEAASVLERIAARTLSVIAPRTGVYSIESEAVSRDPQVVRDYDSDPLNCHCKLPARTVAELADEVARFPVSVLSLKLPLLVMHGSADRIVPVAATELVYGQAASEDKTKRIYDGLFHEILNEPERELVVSEILEWLDARAAATPRAAAAADA